MPDGLTESAADVEGQRPFIASLDKLFRDGAWAGDILFREFGTDNVLAPELIARAAAAFHGWWKLKTDVAPPELPVGARTPSRRVVVKGLAAGEGVAKPLSERAYVTSRVPRGIKGSDLPWVDGAIRRETILIWFLANFEPARGTFFGFAEAQADGPGVQPATDGPTFDGTHQYDGSLTFDGKPLTFGGKPLAFDGRPTTFGTGENIEICPRPKHCRGRSGSGGRPTRQCGNRSAHLSAPAIAAAGAWQAPLRP